MEKKLFRLYRRALHHELAPVSLAILGLAVCTGLLDFAHVYVSYRLGDEVLQWGTIAFEYTLWWSTYIIVCSIALLMASRFALTPGVVTSRVAVHFVAALLLAYTHAICNALVDTPRSGLIAETLPRVVYLAGLDFPIDFISYWAIVGLSSAFSYYSIARRNEEWSRRSALYVRSLIEASPDPLVTISREGKITDVNQATELVTGVRREALIGSDFSDYFTDPNKARHVYQRVFAAGKVRDYPLTLRSAVGSVTEIHNPNVDPRSGSVCFGVWKLAPHGVYKLAHRVWSYDTNGNFMGTINLSETVTLGHGGNSQSGSFTLDFYDPSGNFQMEVAGNVTGQRISVD